MNTDNSDPSDPSSLRSSSHSKKTADHFSSWQTEDSDQFSRSHHQADDDYDGQLVVEDISNQESDKHDPSIEVVSSYQYEDPQSDSSSKSTSRVPKRLEYDELSDSGLVRSIGTLSCDKDRKKPRRRRTQNVGRKRKPTSPVGQKMSSRPGLVGMEVHDATCGQGSRPSKLRRRNSEGEDTETPLSSDYTPESTRTEDDNSSAMATSGETSADDSTSSTSEGDPMDID